MESKTLRTLKAHVALNVRDVEKSIGFYGAMLGLAPCKVRAGYAKFDVQEPPLNLTLNERAEVTRGGGALSHMGIQVASTADVLALGEHWRAAGLETFDEMGTNCCYALQDKTWVTDPDGNSWEAFVVLEDNPAESHVCCTDAALTAKASKSAGAQTPAGAQASVMPAEMQASASCCMLETTIKEGQAVTECVATCCDATPVALSR
jgi:catechol 2,3-dioxygenase-like lactoylglutathione lyase family enzyme